MQAAVRRQLPLLRPAQARPARSPQATITAQDLLRRGKGCIRKQEHRVFRGEDIQPAILIGTEQNGSEYCRRGNSMADTSGNLYAKMMNVLGVYVQSYQ